jgi:serine/threonine-protein kinase
MTIRHGDRIGPYDVVALIDSGGQGDVFRARDVRLSREVALKVVSGERFDERRRARLEREAHALGLINHPNIATLFGVEFADGLAALAMEFVEGESLAARLAKGALPVPDALRIARQIADALETAHGHGIVHRDLKPANVMIRRDGVVKVLDFGLAKPLAEGGAGATAPTLTAGDGGVAIVGTAAYLSPEQARGAEIGRQTDVWAFGCVLYEMLVGRRAFDGATSSDAIASVLTREPDLDALPAAAGGGIRRLVRRCLQKDPRERLRDLGDARLEIDDALEPREGTDSGQRGGRRAVWRYAAVMAAAAAATAMALRVGWPQHVPAAAISRLSVSFPASAPHDRRSWHSVAIAPDGARIAYATPRGLAIRSRDRLDVDLLQDVGTFVSSPFFSRDGLWLGFLDGSELKRVPVSGGAPTVVAAVGHGATASWGEDAIVLADARGLFLVAPEGGDPHELKTAALGAGEHPAYPQMLPGRRGVLFTVLPAHVNMLRGSNQPAGARIDVVDLRTGEQKTLLHGGIRATALPTGHLVYQAGQRLLAVRFDPQRIEVAGEPVEVESADVAEYAVSDEGTLVFPSGTVGPPTLVWVGRTGQEEPLGTPPRHYVYVRLSPDDTRVATVLHNTQTRDVEVWDVRRRTLVRFTHDPADNGLVAWSPDGARLAFSSDRFGTANLFWQAADGSGAPERLRVSDRLNQPLAFTPDGRLLFSADVPNRVRDIYALTLVTREVQPVIASPAAELNAEVSPDGRWIAYDSNASGQFEIYVRPYPDTTAGQQWQVSAGGGRQPVWAKDGRELYYRNFAGDVMGCAIPAGSAFTPGAPSKLVDGAAYAGGGSIGGGMKYDVASDGRFLMIKRSPPVGGSAPTLVVVQNWFEELKRLVPAN